MPPLLVEVLEERRSRSRPGRICAVFMHLEYSNVLSIYILSIHANGGFMYSSTYPYTSSMHAC